jgi:hypothetical protein
MTPAEGRAKIVALAMEHLKRARTLLDAAGAVKTVERVRLAISSAKGAQRHAGTRDLKDERQTRAQYAQLRRLDSGACPNDPCGQHYAGCGCVNKAEGR